MSVTNTQLYLTFFLLTCSSSSSAVPLPGAVLKFCTALFFPRMTISIKAWVKTPKIHSCTQEPAWVMLPACHGTKPGTFDGGSSTRGMAAITNTVQKQYLVYSPWFSAPPTSGCEALSNRRIKPQQTCKGKWTLKAILKVIFQFVWQDLGQTCAHKHL